jgi:hypothetical protein
MPKEEQKKNERGAGRKPFPDKNLLKQTIEIGVENYIVEDFGGKKSTQNIAKTLLKKEHETQFKNKDNE